MKPWEIKAKADGDLEIFIYDQIGKDFFGDGTSAKDFVQDLKDAGNPKNILLRINSPGGEVFDGLAIYNALLSHPAKVTSQIDGIAASIASVIAMAGDEVIMAENALVMIHNPRAFVAGDSEVMRQMAAVMDKVRDSMILAYQRHTSMTNEKIVALMNAETWMSAEEAKRDGFATGTIEADGLIAASAKKFDFSKFEHVPEALIDGPKKGAVTVDLEALRSQVQGIKIAAQANSTAKAEEKNKMETTETTTAEVKVDNYNEVAAEILATCIKYNIDSKFGETWIRAKKSLSQAKEACADIVMARAQEQRVTSGVAQPTVDGMTAGERDKYSIVRAISELADGKGNGAGLERSVSDSIAKTIGIPSKGMYIPTRIKGALDTKSGGAGGYGVETQVQDLIELLRNRLLVLQLGATALTGLRDNLAFPVRLSGSVGAWVSQNPGSDVTDSDASFGQKVMSPKTYQVTTAFSRQFLSQSTIDVEAMVRADLAFDHARAVDAAAINGAGLSNEPLGLLKTTGIGDVAIGGSGGAPTYGTIVDLETAVADANADAPGMKFLTTPVMRGKLRKTEQFATTNGQPVWQQTGGSDGVGDLLGYGGYVSKQVPRTLVKGGSSDCHAIIMGYWPSMLIGEWGFIEIIVDPYRLKKQNVIEVTSFQMVDVLLRQPAQFAACQDARNV